MLEAQFYQNKKEKLKKFVFKQMLKYRKIKC